jgi:hypothetical protein
MKEKWEEQMRQNRSETIDIDLFFYKPSTFTRLQKRKVWIYIPFESNSRLWDSFSERRSTRMNLSYMNLCIKSIVDCCAEKYDIVVFSDSDFEDLLKLPVDHTKLSGALLENYRNICLMKILYEYGGVIVPPSLYLKDSLEKLDNPYQWYVSEMVNTDNVSNQKMLPSSKLCGSNAKNPELLMYIQHLEKQDRSVLESHFCENYFVSKQVPVVDGGLIGTKNKSGPILLEDLMSDQVLDLPDNNIGLYMPSEVLKKRLQYQWFCKMSESQVIECNCSFSYYILGVKKDCDCNRIE